MRTEGKVMNTYGFHVKPLALAVAAALCVGLASSVAAKEAASGASNAQAVAPAQNAVQPNPADTTAKAVADAKKKKRRSDEQKRITTLQAVTVKGIAGSQERDIILKRYAAQIEDSITAQNIGQLPDVDISDAIARIPGVQISRSGGEGTAVSVDGLPQVKTTLNGEAFLSPGGSNGLVAGGSPNLQSGQPDFVDIPPTLFQGVDVIKSIMASNLAGGVSGIINLRTHRPFDFKKGWTFSASQTNNWGDRIRKVNKGGSFLASYRTDRWGALLTASYSGETIANKQPTVSYYNTGSETTEQDVGFDFNGDGVIGNSLDPTKLPRDYYYQWDPMRVGTEFTKRDRTGINGSFEFKFNDALKLTADAAYTKLNETDTSYSYQFQNGGIPGGLQPGPVTPVISPEGVFLKGISDFDQLTQFTETARGPSDSLNTNLQLDFDNGGFFSGSLRWVHGKASRDYTDVGADSNVNQGDLLPLPDGTYGYDNPNGIPNAVPVLVNFEGKYPSFSILENVTNPAQWVLTSAYAEANKINAGMNVYRADGTLHFNTDVLDSFDFGARYEKQSYAFNNEVYLTPISPAGACADPLGPGPYDAYYRFIDPRVIDSCSGFSEIPRTQLTQLPAGWLGSYSNFSPIGISGVGMGPQGLPVVNASAMGDPVKFLQQVAPEATGKPALYRLPGSSYTVDEDIASIYGQFNLSGQLGAFPWTANAGMRGVRTTLYIGSYLTNEADYIGNGGAFNGVLLNLGKQINVDQYTSWLPAVNLAFDITSDQKLRLAFSKTQARQDLSNLGQGLTVYYGANGTPPRNPSLPANAQLFSSGYAGNPHLKPYTSTNYNLSYAWYFTPHSIAYLGAFFMNVSAFPENVTQHENLPDADGVVRAGGPVSTIINGGGAIVKGLEGEFRTQFTSLPGALSGFG
ncbi:MAG: TonB-dependent receptor, partial [Rhodanobacter sp.]